MKRWTVRLLLLLVLAGAVFWIWRTFFPSPQQVIRKQLAELAQCASIAPNEAPLARAFNAQKLAGFFSPEVEIMVNAPGHLTEKINGRDELLRAAAVARSSLTGLKVQFVDVGVVVEPNARSAVAHLTAEANIPGESVPEVQELNVNFERVDRTWLIRRVETVRTLR